MAWQITWDFSDGFVLLERDVVFVDFVGNVAGVAWDDIVESLTFEHVFIGWKLQ